MADHGLEVLGDQRFTIPRKWYRLATDNWAVCIDDTARLAMGRGQGDFGTCSEWDELYQKMLVELGGGVSLATDFVGCLGRKKMIQNTDE